MTLLYPSSLCLPSLSLSPSVEPQPVLIALLVWHLVVCDSKVKYRIPSL